MKIAVEKIERNVCSFVHLFIHSPVRSFIRSFVRLFIRSSSARRSPVGDEGTTRVDMATPRLTSSSTRMPAQRAAAPAAPPERQAVMATPDPDAIAGEGIAPPRRGGALRLSRAEQRGKRPHALHTCSRSRGEENEGDGMAAKERDGVESELVGRSASCTCLSHARAPCRN